MRDIELQELLELCHKELDVFFNPQTTDGFIKHWAAWVVENWSAGSYFDSKIVDVGYDTSEFPEQTNAKLKERCKTYVDFIFSNTGQTVATHVSGSGIALEKHEELLRQYFAGAATNKINEISELYNIQMPTRYKKEIDKCNSISEIVYQDFFDHESDKNLYKAADNLVLDFGVLGVKINEFGYIPDIYHDGAKETYEKTWCADLTLDDIKLMVNVKGSQVN